MFCFVKLLQKESSSVYMFTQHTLVLPATTSSSIRHVLSHISHTGAITILVLCDYSRDYLNFDHVLVYLKPFTDQSATSLKKIPKNLSEGLLF